MAELKRDKLYSDLKKLTPNKWYNIFNHPEYDRMVKFIKSFIDEGDDYEFSSDYKRVRFISDQFTVNWEDAPNIRIEDKLCPPDKYGKQAKYREFYIGDKLVSTKSI